MSNKVAATAALLATSVVGAKGFNAWYDSDRFGGMVGFIDYVVTVATALEAQTQGTMQIGEGIDWYLTVDSVAAAILQDRLELTNLQPHFHHWEA